jgi:hypothetical protein
VTPEAALLAYHEALSDLVLELAAQESPGDTQRHEDEAQAALVPYDAPQGKHGNVLEGRT